MVDIVFGVLPVWVTMEDISHFLKCLAGAGNSPGISEMTIRGECVHVCSWVSGVAVFRYQFYCFELLIAKTLLVVVLCLMSYVC